jgi:hypothetical protein
LGKNPQLTGQNSILAVAQAAPEALADVQPILEQPKRTLYNITLTPAIQEMAFNFGVSFVSKG